MATLSRLCECLPLASGELTSIRSSVTCYDLMMHDRLVSSTDHLPTPHTRWTDILCDGISWFLRYLLASPIGCTFQLGASLPPSLGSPPDQMSTSRCPQTIFSVEILPSRHHSHPHLPAIGYN